MSTIAQELSGPRLSSLVYGCARQCWYQAKGAPSRPPSEQMLRWFRRGHAVSNAIRDEVVAELRAEGQAPRRELEIPWPIGDPIGVGHADLYIPQDHRVVEITSTTGGTLQPHKARQVAAYAMNLPRAEEAYVLAIDPSSWVDRWYPVDWEALAPEIRDLEQQLVSALRQDAPPARCCKSPADAERYRCAHVDVCFADWDEPEMDSLLDQETVDLVGTLALLDADVRKLEGDAKALKASRESIRDELRPRVPVGEQIRAGEHLVKRIQVSRTSFSLKAALDAGHTLPEDLEPFVSTSESERWYLT